MSDPKEGKPPTRLAHGESHVAGPPQRSVTKRDSPQPIARRPAPPSFPEARPKVVHMGRPPEKKGTRGGAERGEREGQGRCRGKSCEKGSPTTTTKLAPTLSKTPDRTLHFGKGRALGNVTHEDLSEVSRWSMTCRDTVQQDHQRRPRVRPACRLHTAAFGCRLQLCAISRCSTRCGLRRGRHDDGMRSSYTMKASASATPLGKATMALGVRLSRTATARLSLGRLARLHRRHHRATLWLGEGIWLHAVPLLRHPVPVLRHAHRRATHTARWAAHAAHAHRRASHAARWAAHAAHAHRRASHAAR
eukprot:scaffold57476_cov30-Tisochrysis_lutea.AAC.2